ncbi:MAG: hypothetical protein ACE5E7_06325 [Anaerolineae bacterium]
MNETSKWIAIHDAEVTADALMAQIEERVMRRREEHGILSPQFPSFGYVSQMPEPPAQGGYSPNLYYCLRQLNHMEPPETMAALDQPSPMARLPLIGRLWQLVRSQAHSLILFYVNRVVAHNSLFQGYLVSAVNELTRQTQLQQQEIERLQAELDAIKTEESL